MKFKIPTFFLDDSTYIDSDTKRSTRFAWFPVYVDEPVKTVVWLEKYILTQSRKYREDGEFGYRWKTKHRRCIGNDANALDNLISFLGITTFFGIFAFLVYSLDKLFSIF